MCYCLSKGTPAKSVLFSMFDRPTGIKHFIHFLNSGLLLDIVQRTT